MPPKERWIGRPHRRSPIIPNFTYLGTISGHAPFELVSAPTTDPSSFASGTLPLHPQRGSALRDFSGSLPGPRGKFRLRECCAPREELLFGEAICRQLCSRWRGCQGEKRACSESGTREGLAGRLAQPFAPKIISKAWPVLVAPGFWRGRAGMFIHHCASANAVPMLMRT